MKPRSQKVRARVVLIYTATVVLLVLAANWQETLSDARSGIVYVYLTIVHFVEGVGELAKSLAVVMTVVLLGMLFWGGVKAAYRWLADWFLSERGNHP